MEVSRKPNAILKMLLGITGIVVFFVVLLLLQGLFFTNRRDQEERSKAAAATAELARLRSEQLELLHSYRWVDQTKGVVAIPIERAMLLVVTEENSKPVAPVIRN